MGTSPEYPGSTESAPTEANTTNDLKTKTVEMASRAKAAVTNSAQSVLDKAESKRQAVAGGLESAASALHRQADTIHNAAHRGADQLQHAADYTRENDVRTMMRDLSALVKAHPGKSLAGAVAAGFIFARAFRRR